MFTANKIKALVQLLSTPGHELNTMADERQTGHLEAMAQARITVEGRDADAESLWDWLRHEPQLRGLRAGSASGPTPSETVGER